MKNFNNDIYSCMYLSSLLHVLEYTYNLIKLDMYMFLYLIKYMYMYAFLFSSKRLGVNVHVYKYVQCTY